MNTKLFNDGWLFQKKGDSEWKSVEIPHDWLIWDVNNLYKSDVGCYKKIFYIDELETGQRVYINFDGVYMDSVMYVNGNKVGEWKYGYTAFEFDITDYLAVSATNEVFMEVNYQSPNSRWYSGAGMYRDCTLKIKNAVHFNTNGIYITTERQSDTNWRVIVDAEVYTDTLYEIKHTIEDLSHVSNTDGSISVHNPVLWDITNPMCYILRSELIVDGKVTDISRNRFGFREIKFTTDKGFFLNGKRIKIFGACQHHDLGSLGAAIDKDVLKRQLIKLQEMGVNAIRTAHNPPAAAFMELTDEMGILVMSEFVDMWKRPKTTYDYARFFDDWTERDVAAWIRRDRNCPSIIMWSVGNEIYDTHVDAADGKRTLDYLVELVNRNDPRGNAPATLCSNYMAWENTQKCVQDLKLVGYNYSEYLYHDHHAKFSDWIIYGSETSSTVQSRGVYHFPYSKATLSEDDMQCSSLGNCCITWGARNSEACINDDLNADFSLGQFIWTGTDYIGEPTPYQTKNSYFGQIDTAGFPKDSFYIYQSAWTDYKTKPMIHIFPYWDFSPSQPIDVRVCSNMPKTELYFNGDLVTGTIIPYKAGELRAVGYDENGNKIVEAVKKSFGDAAEIKANISQVGHTYFAEIFAVDVTGNIVENANNRIRLSVANGEILGMDNGDSTDFDQYKTNNRRLFNGKLIAIIRTNDGGVPQLITEFDKSDIPIRKIELCMNGLEITAKTYPENATYNDLHWRLTNEAGVDSHIGTLAVSEYGRRATIIPKGDGEIFIRCATKNGKEHVDRFSIYPTSLKGYGTPVLNPYSFVSAGLCDIHNGNLTTGNERGVSTANYGESYVGFSNVDFGFGSNELTVSVYSMNSESLPIQIWKGMPGEGTLLTTFLYNKDYIWNTYQSADIILPETLKGVETICFVFDQKVHMKGFEFKQIVKAFQKINFIENDALYGDTFAITNQAVENIGNNVSAIFNDMDFTCEAESVEVCWRSKQDINTVRIVFVNESGEESINIVSLATQTEYSSMVFILDNKLLGKGKVSFIFLPGCDIDIAWFKFRQKTS